MTLIALLILAACSAFATRSLPFLRARSRRAISASDTNPVARPGRTRRRDGGSRLLRQAGSGIADSDSVALDKGASLSALHLSVRRVESEAGPDFARDAAIVELGRAEAFIGSDFDHIARYKEFSVPAG